MSRITKPPTLPIGNTVFGIPARELLAYGAIGAAAYAFLMYDPTKGMDFAFRLPKEVSDQFEGEERKLIARNDSKSIEKYFSSSSPERRPRTSSAGSLPPLKMPREMQREPEHDSGYEFDDDDLESEDF